MKNIIYDKNYYENGEELNISGYTNYRWLPHLTKPMCESLIAFAKIKKTQSILDFGCAKGFLVKAFTQLGFNATGVDISEYAISEGDPEIKDKIFLYRNEQTLIKIKQKLKIENFDIVISKDVFEHIPYDKIDKIIHTLSKHCKRMFVVVPLGNNNKYIVDEYEKDITHIIREDLSWWKNIFIKNGYSNVTSSYKIKGIKENWSHYPKGNGFFLCSGSINVIN